jgi:hypothetical protein
MQFPALFSRTCVTRDSHDAERRNPTRIIDSEEPEDYSSVVLYVVVGLKGYSFGCRLELSKVSLRNV